MEEREKSKELDAAQAVLLLAIYQMEISRAFW